jgi:hypothetical protein
MILGCQQSVEVPQKFKKWNCGDGSFAIEYPARWIPKGGINKNQGSSHLVVEKGGVSIRVDASFQDSVMGDLLGNAGDLSETPDDYRPEALLHEKNLDYYTENYRNYEEGPGETKRLPIGMTRITEFTASEGMGMIHGIRATAITRDRGVTFRAYAPESQWEDFRPVFYQLLDGMKRGVEK